MNYFILASSSTLAASRIARHIVRDVPGSACHICTSIKTIGNNLQEVVRQSCTAILLASNHTELDQILQLADFFEGLPLILMVPDESAGTIAKAHLLRPRYLMRSRIDFGELLAVIKKIGAGRKHVFCIEPMRSRLRVITVAEKRLGRLFN